MGKAAKEESRSNHACKVKRITLCLFYILLLFFPTQLGRHFFFNFSLISGIRSDYLAPTIYLTDVLIFLTAGIYFVSSINPSADRQVLSIRKKKNLRFTTYPLYLLVPIFYLVFNCFFIAGNKWVAIYKFIKIVEYILFGYVVIKIKPKIKTVLTVLSISVLYSSLIAIWQFIIQKSIGGFFWFLGERTFYSSTVGIAVF